MLVDAARFWVLRPRIAPGDVINATSETMHASPVDDAKRVGALIARRIIKMDTAERWLAVPCMNSFGLGA
ncbi:hypothetical protein B0G84_8218 [Paraburkholderia sp. BL8N3]|nr:hypothetical protein B0G84_8218 [Paraburkholderia sp. BL8N3]